MWVLDQIGVTLHRQKNNALSEKWIPFNHLFSRRMSMEGGNTSIATKTLEAKPVYKHRRSASVSEVSAGCQVDEKRSQQEMKWLDLLKLRDQLKKVSPSFWSVRNYFNAQLLKINSSYSEENCPKVWPQEEKLYSRVEKANRRNADGLKKIKMTQTTDGENGGLICPKGNGELSVRITLMTEPGNF